MEWIEALRGAVVGLDTAPFIYLIEENPLYLPIVRPFFEALDRGEFQAVTSVITLTEVLVHPMRHGDHELAHAYRRTLLRANHPKTIPVTEAIAGSAAEIRATHGLRTPDAIQLATAARSGASFFVTNDSRLPGLGPVKTLVLGKLIAAEP